MSVLRVKNGDQWDIVPAIKGDTGDPAEPGSITDAMLAPDGIKQEVAWLWGNQLTGEVTGDLLTAADAYAAPPLALTVDGRSTQDGTPTPDAPVPIVSVDSVELHASADGTTDYGDWPVHLYDGTLRSLPDNTKDTLSLTYLRPSTREGWAVYSRMLVQRVLKGSIESFVSLVSDSDTRQAFRVSAIQNSRSLSPSLNDRLLDRFSYYSGAGNYGHPGQAAIGPTLGTCVFDPHRFASLTEANEWVAENPIAFQVPLATPVTTTLDPIELPVLPAPTCTVWADPTTGLRMEYVRDTSIVIASLEAAYADLATS